MARLLTLLAALLLAASSHAEDRMLAGQRLAAACANCHGTDGHAVGDGKAVLTPLAGMPAQQLRDKMKAFRDGSASATVMQQLAKGFNEQEVALLADYFASRKEAR